MIWLAMLLHLMALGTAGAIAFVPAREIGKYYFKFHATTVLVTVVLAVIVGRPWTALGAGPPLARIGSFLAMVFAAAVLVQNIVVRATRDVPRKDALLFPVSFGVTFVALWAFGGREADPAQASLMAVHLLTSAAVLGTSLAAMSTGHWYLSNAKLPFDILIGLTRAYLVSLVLKAAVSGLYVALRFPEYRRLEDFDLLVMGTRWVAGLLLAGVLGLMALSCARRKANQSATGILYVAVVFVLIGETMSLALSLGEHPRPI